VKAEFPQPGVYLVLKLKSIFASVFKGCFIISLYI